MCLSSRLWGGVLDCDFQFTILSPLLFDGPRLWRSIRVLSLSPHTYKKNPAKMAGKWPRFGGSWPIWELAWTMNWVDRLRTSADKRMWSGRRAVVMRTGRRAELLGVKLGCPRSCCRTVVVCMCADMIYVYICMCVCICTSMRLYTCVCVFVCKFVQDCGSWYQCFSVWKVSCMRLCFRVHIHAYTYVFKYIYMCIFFCSECYMHFTGAVGTSAWEGVYVTEVCFYTNVQIYDTLAAGYAHMCICIYVFICMHMHMDAYVRLWYCLTRWGVVK